MILELRSSDPIQTIDFTDVDAVFLTGEEPFCDYAWVLDIRRQCIEHTCLFHFVSTGPVFIKDGKTYHIPEEQQKSQAKKAQIDHDPHQDLFERLSHSKFRSSFHLRIRERLYFEQKGWAVIDQHAHDFIRERLAPAHPKNDGKQTPMKGHPVFLAQHATGTCCRSCLEKWHHIPKGIELTETQQSKIVSILLGWILRQESSLQVTMRKNQKRHNK